MGENGGIEWGRRFSVKPGELFLREMRYPNGGLRSIELMYFDTPEKNQTASLTESRPDKDELGRPALNTRPHFSTYAEPTNEEVEFSDRGTLIHKKKATTQDLRNIVMGMSYNELKAFRRDVATTDFSRRDKVTLLRVCDELLKQG